MADEHVYTVKSDSVAMVAICFKDPEDALKFVGACGFVAVMDPEDVDANDLILTLKRSAESFSVHTKEKGALDRIADQMKKDDHEG